VTVTTVPVTTFEGSPNTGSANPEGTPGAGSSSGEGTQGAATGESSVEGSTSPQDEEAASSSSPTGEPHVASSTSPAPDVQPDAMGHEICPICIVEFEDGDDVRILPCEGKHQFHQHCVDPWLLELSSSCPLCREDFHALEAMISGNPEALHEENHVEPPTPVAAPGERPRSSRFSRYLRFARRHQRHPEAPVEEEGPDPNLNTTNSQSPSPPPPRSPRR